MTAILALPPPGWRRLRLLDLLERFGGRCVYCDRRCFMPGTPGVAWFKIASADHDLPKARRGPTCRKNLVLACAGCNSVKGTMRGAEFRHLIETGQLHPEFARHIAAQTLRALVRHSSHVRLP